MPVGPTLEEGAIVIRHVAQVRLHVLGERSQRRVVRKGQSDRTRKEIGLGGVLEFAAVPSGEGDEAADGTPLGEIKPLDHLEDRVPELRRVDACHVEGQTRADGELIENGLCGEEGLQVDGRERAFVHETDLSVGGFERDGLPGRETGDVHLGALADRHAVAAVKGVLGLGEVGAVEKFDAAEVDAGLALVLVRRERVALVPAEKHGIGAGEADVAHVDVLRSLLLGFRQAGIVDLDLAGCLDPALGVVEADGVLELKRADGSKLERAPVDERAALYKNAGVGKLDRALVCERAVFGNDDLVDGLRARELDRCGLGVVAERGHPRVIPGHDFGNGARSGFLFGVIAVAKCEKEIGGFVRNGGLKAPLFLLPLRPCVHRAGHNAAW